jgi:hypothetical protein
MKEIIGDLFDQNVNIICITTNATLKKDGACVAGCGVALQATKRWPEFPIRLGQCIKTQGNSVHPILDTEKYHVWSFPVKHNYWEDADLNLIEQSCKQLVNLVDEWQWIKFFGEEISVALPRPGCGAGKLKWVNVKPICEKYLDNRFIICEKEPS